MSIELLNQNHRDAIIDAFEKTERRIRIISPFVQESMTRYLVDSMGKGDIVAQLITRFYREDFIRSVSSLTALKSLQKIGVDIYALKDLHTKLYLFDHNVAIIGSANFTGGGFGNNIELSLYIKDEYDLIAQLLSYFDKMLLSIQASGNFKILDNNIEDEILIVQKAIKGRDQFSKSNPMRFGAELSTKQFSDEVPADEVENILGLSNEVVSAVLKFEGAAHRRIDPNDIYKPNHYNRQRIYFTASPKSPRSLNADTTVFLSVVSRDKSGAETPIIVGRAKTKGYDPHNVIDDYLIKEHPWAIDYKYYVELYDIETVDTEIINCISLNNMIAEVGYRLYPNTENNPATPIQSLRIRHHQKAYIMITPHAANRLNTMLELLFNKYGKSFF
jgi:HKD family nuclease